MAGVAPSRTIRGVARHGGETNGARARKSLGRELDARAIAAAMEQRCERYVLAARADAVEKNVEVQRLASERKSTSDMLQFAETKILSLPEKLQLDETNMTAMKASVQNAIDLMVAESAARERALHQLQIAVLQAATPAAGPDAASAPLFQAFENFTQEAVRRSQDAEIWKEAAKEYEEEAKQVIAA